MEKILRAIAKFGRLLMKAFVYIAFRPKIRYVNKDRKKCDYGEPVIFIGNHTSHMDGVVSAMIFDRCKAYILVAKDWYEKKNINWYLRSFYGRPPCGAGQYYLRKAVRHRCSCRWYARQA